MQLVYCQGGLTQRTITQMGRSREKVKKHRFKVFLISVSTSIGTKNERICSGQAPFNGAPQTFWGSVASNSPLDSPLFNSD